MPDTMPTDQYNIGVRKALNDMGVADQHISYDPNSGYVKAYGKNVIRPQANRDGNTYTDQATLNSIVGDVNMLKQQNQLMGQVVNPQQTANPYDSQIRDTFTQFMNAMKNPTVIDRNAVYQSPQYAAYQAQTQRDANQATRQAQESLGGAGLGRSSVLTDRTQRIQNDANQYLETQAVPQILSQLQAQETQKNQNLFNLLNALTQQQGVYDTRDQNQFNRASSVLDFLTGRQDKEFENQRLLKNDQLNETQVMAQLTGRMPDGTPTNAAQQQELQNLWAVADQTGTIPDALADFYGMPKGTKTFQAVQAALDNQRADRQLDISQQNANTSSANARINALMDVWQKTGKAPAGLESLGIAEGTSLAEAKNTNDTQELEGLYSGLQSGQIDPAAAIDEINNKTRIGLYTPAQAAGLLAIVQQFNTTKPVTPMPAATDQQIQVNGGVNYQDMSMKEIENLWNSDPTGKEAGRPLIDWGQWVKDPRGKSAGVTYEAWHQAYGPSLRAK